MKRINDILVCLVFIVISKLVFSQGESKDVSIIVTGSGKTVEEAKQVSLRNAIEQAYGTFISAKTEVLNDQVLSDEISSVSTGNIKSYEILSQDQLPNGLWATTLKTIVSVDKLTSFVESKGLSVEIKGGLFALNIKQQMLNEQGEIRAITDMLGIIHESMQISFDYSIKSSNPQSLDSENKNWKIPLEVIVTVNKNIDFCAKYLKKILFALSLSRAEERSYESVNKKVYPVSIIYQNKLVTYNFRTIHTVRAINSLSSNWNFYLGLFKVYSGLEDSSKYNCLTKFKFIGIKHETFNNDKESASFLFPNLGSVVGTFSWSDNYTLSQIEQITSFKVMPLGIISNFKHGGYVVYEKYGHGLVVPFFDLGKFEKRDDAIAACENLSYNGYNDWRIPTIEDLQLIDKNIFKGSSCGLCQVFDSRIDVYNSSIGGLFHEIYWSNSEENGYYTGWYFNNLGNSYKYGIDFFNKKPINARPVRSF
jgi:hypothetical protein